MNVPKSDIGKFVVDAILSRNYDYTTVVGLLDIHNEMIDAVLEKLAIQNDIEKLISDECNNNVTNVGALLTVSIYCLKDCDRPKQEMFINKMIEDTHQIQELLKESFNRNMQHICLHLSLRIQILLGVTRYMENINMTALFKNLFSTVCMELFYLKLHVLQIFI